MLLIKVMTPKRYLKPFFTCVFFIKNSFNDDKKHSSIWLSFYALRNLLHLRIFYSFLSIDIKYFNNEYVFYTKITILESAK